jgi:hypothetical protein
VNNAKTTLISTVVHVHSGVLADGTPVNNVLSAESLGSAESNTGLLSVAINGKKWFPVMSEV